MHTREEKLKAFGRLLDVLDELREKCPWDRKQTNESLRPNTIEETFELCDALLKDDEPNICKELGDVLLHVCFYAKIGQEKQQFDMADVCNKLVDKLIFRHPHVYHPSQVGAPDPKPLPYGEKEEERDNSEEVKTAQQACAIGCARCSARTHQGLPHTGQGAQCRLRLGRQGRRLGQGARGTWRTGDRTAQGRPRAFDRRIRRLPLLAHQCRTSVQNQSRHGS